MSMRLSACYVVFGAAAALAAIYLIDGQSSITARDQTIEVALVNELSMADGEEPEQIWKRIGLVTGEPNPITMSKRHYEQAVSMLADELARTRFSADREQTRQELRSQQTPEQPH